MHVVRPASFPRWRAPSSPKSGAVVRLFAAVLVGLGTLPAVASAQCTEETVVMDFDAYAYYTNSLYSFESISEDGYILQADLGVCINNECLTPLSIYGLNSSIAAGDPDVSGGWAGEWLVLTKEDGGLFDADSIELRRRLASFPAYATIEGVREDGSVVSTTFTNLGSSATYPFGAEFSSLVALRLYNGGGGSFNEYYFFDDITLTSVCGSDPDSDGDGVFDAEDACPDTTSSPVDDNGCAIDQYCECDDDWRNHGAYVSCVAQTAEDFLEQGLIDKAEKDARVSEAGRSACGQADSGWRGAPSRSSFPRGPRGR